MKEFRQVIIHTRQKPATSERQTCQVIDLPSSSLQYRSAPKDDKALRLALVRLTKQYGDCGYRKTAELQCVERLKANYKVERLWRKEGLKQP